jgi:FkbM family methyltransferase
MVKRALAPVVGTRPYQLAQSLSMGWDIRTGNWTEPELSLIPHVVKPGDNAIDIGANYGLYAYHLARSVGQAGKVYAFEPIPYTCASFRQIAGILRMSNVEIIEKGCGDVARRATFNLPLQDNGAIIAGTVHLGARDNDRKGKEQHARFEKTKQIECDIVVVDDYLGALDRVSFLKCDIEGADFYALKGCTKIIEKNLPVVVSEINPWFLEGFGVNLAEFIEFFTSRGYDMYRFQRGRLVKSGIADVVEDNWVFVHRDKRAPLAGLM